MPQPLEPIHIVYYGWDRKPCQVQLDDGVRVYAEIRSWDRDERGLVSLVACSRGPGKSTHLERFPSERVRSMADETD